MCLPLLAALPAAASAASGLVPAVGVATAGSTAASGISAATALQALGAGVTAAGTIQGGMTAKAQAEAQAAMAKRTAEIERKRGAFDAERLRDRGSRIMGRQRANLLASGVALTGSAEGVLTDTASELSLDEQAIAFNTANRVGNADYEAKLAKVNGRSAMTGSIMGAFAPVLGAATNIARFNQNRTILQNPYETI